LKKVGRIILTVAFVGILYIMMALFQPAINTLIVSANTSANWSAHAEFPKTQALMIGWPFWSYLIPASIGVIVSVQILRSNE